MMIEVVYYRWKSSGSAEYEVLHHRNDALRIILSYSFST